jgi:hypothetical protein
MKPQGDKWCWIPKASGKQVHTCRENKYVRKPIPGLKHQINERWGVPLGGILGQTPCQRFFLHYDSNLTGLAACLDLYEDDFQDCSFMCLFDHVPKP